MLGKASKIWERDLCDNYLFTSVTDGNSIEICFNRTIISVNQLSTVRTRWDPTEQSQICVNPLFEPANLLIMAPRPSIEIPAQENYCKVQRTSGKASTTRSIDRDLYWCRIPDNSWRRTVLHDKAHWRVLTVYRNQWHVVNTLCHEVKNQLTRKVGFEGTPKLDPSWKSQPVTSKVNVEWKLKNFQSVNKQFSLVGQNFSWIEQVGHRLDRQRVRRQRAGNLWNEDGIICVTWNVDLRPDVSTCWQLEWQILFVVRVIDLLTDVVFDSGRTVQVQT